MGSQVVDFLLFDRASGALQRGRPDTVPVHVHGGAQPRRHPLPRPARRPSAAPFRPAAGAVLNPAVVAARPRGHGGRRRPGRVPPPFGLLRARRPWFASPTSRRPTARPARRSTPRIRSSRSRSGSRCSPSSKASASRSRSAPPACCSSLLNALDLGIGAVIVFGLVLGVVWTASRAWSCTGRTRAALADEVRRRALVRDRPRRRRATSRRSGHCSGPTMHATCVSAWICSQASPHRQPRSSFGTLAEHSSPEVRVRALGQLAATGDARAAAAGRIARGATSPVPATPSIGGRRPPPRPARRRGRRPAACSPHSSTTPTCRYGRGARCRRARRRRATRRSCAASSRRSRTPGPPAARPQRLGDSATPRCRLLAAALARADAPRRASLVRAAAAAAAEHGVWIVAPALDDPDRVVVLDGARRPRRRRRPRPRRAEVLDAVFLDATALAARALAARIRARRAGRPARPGARRRGRPRSPAGDRRAGAPSRRSGPRGRARRRPRRGRTARDRGRGSRRAPVPRRGRARAPARAPRSHAGGRSAALRRTGPAGRRAEEWIADIAGDPEGVWRSSWLAACAHHAVERRGRESSA